MSIFEYLGSQKISAEVYRLTTGNEFYSLLMAAFRYADTETTEKLVDAFPEVYKELRERYNAPGGALNQGEMEFLLKKYKGE